MDQLLVGVSTLDVTPELGTPLGGYVRYRPASTVHSKLKAKCLVLQCGKNSVLIVAIDAFAIPNRTAGRARLTIAKELGVPADSILIAASHTHSAPDTIGFASPHNRPLAQKYLTTLEGTVIEAAKRAWENRFTAQAYVAYGKAFIGFNRVRWALDQPLYRALLSTRLIRYASRVAQVIPALPIRNRAGLIGPTDPDVNIVWFESEDHRGAVLVNYACHPTILGPRSQVISGDYPSAMATRIEDSLGEGFVVLFANGAAGNINPYTRCGWQCYGTVDDVERLGRSLADEALRAMKSSSKPLSPKLQVKSCTVPLADSGQIQIQLIYFDDRVMVAVPGELFVETGFEMMRQIKQKVVVVGYANGYAGYFPPEEGFRLRCRETERTWWNAAERGVAEKIRSAVMAMMN